LLVLLKKINFEKTITVFIYLFVAFSLISIAGTQISLGFVVLFWIGRMWSERKWLVKRTPLDYAFLFLITTFILSTIFSLEPLASFKNLKNPLLIIIVYALVSNVQEEKTLNRCIAIFIFTAALVSGISLFSTQILEGKKVMGLQSTTMTWAAMSVIFSTLTISQLLFGPRGKIRWWYSAGLVMQVLAMLFSYVRGAWIGFSVALLFLILMKNKKLILVLLALAGATILFSPQPVKQRILNITNLNVGSTQVRLTQWRNSIKIFKDHPITGVGWIDLAKIHKSYAPPGADLNYEAYWIGHFHSNYIMFLVCFGLLGFAALLYFLYKLFTSLWQTWRGLSVDHPALSAWVLGTLAACLGFWVNGIFDWTFGDAEPVSLLWLVIGLAFAIRNRTDNFGR
jgi:putative inorganic carbon (hco3(-)) transporter